MERKRNANESSICIEKEKEREKTAFRKFGFGRRRVRIRTSFNGRWSVFSSGVWQLRLSDRNLAAAAPLRMLKIGISSMAIETFILESSFKFHSFGETPPRIERKARLTFKSKLKLRHCLETANRASTASHTSLQSRSRSASLLRNSTRVTRRSATARLL